MITTVQNIGVLVGYLAAGHAADRIGRKPVFFSAVSIMVIFNFVAYFSVSWIMFAVVRFCIGFGAALYFPVRDNMMIEVASPKWRPILIGIPSFAMFAAFLGLLAWLLKNWRTLHLAIGCFGIPILLTWWKVFVFCCLQVPNVLIIIFICVRSSVKKVAYLGTNIL